MFGGIMPGYTDDYCVSSLPDALNSVQSMSDFH